MINTLLLCHQRYVNSIQFQHIAHGLILNNVGMNRVSKRIPFSLIFLKFVPGKHSLMFPVLKALL